MVRILCLMIGCTLALSFPSVAQETLSPKPDSVKVAAVQISGYDKGELPREGFDPVESLLPYIDRAVRDGAQLVVFPEYILGHIAVPGPATKRIAAAAKSNSIYVIVGCWENSDDGTFDRVGAFGEANIRAMRLSRRSGRHVAL